jgi:hypothetical protein
MGGRGWLATLGQRQSKIPSACNGGVMEFFNGCMSMSFKWKARLTNC